MTAVVTSQDFGVSADAFKASCSVAILIQLAEENIATQPGPPVLAFQVPQTSVLSGVARPVLAGFSRYLAEPQNAPLFWLCRDVGGKEPVAWSMPVGLLAETIVNEQLVAAVKEKQDTLHHSKDGASQPQQQQQPLEFALFQKRSPFPIKLYANFRPTKRHDVFPFYTPTGMTGAGLVTALMENALQCLKRSVAIMNSDSFRNFYSELNPQDMKRLKDFCLMDSPSVGIRAEFSQFHKNVLGTINIVAWPVMIHSLETGRTLTMAVPALVGGSKKSHATTKDSQQQQQQQPKALMGIQAARYSAATNPAAAAAASAADEHEVTKTPSVFQDVVAALATKMNPNHLSHSADGQEVQNNLRKRLRIGGLPVVPPAEVPLRWLMEHMVGADLSLHVLLLPVALA